MCKTVLVLRSVFLERKRRSGHSSCAIILPDPPLRVFRRQLCLLRDQVSEASGDRYRLVQVEHTYAVFVQKAHAPVLAPRASEPTWTHDAWMQGWQCSPLARYFDRLEELRGYGSDFRDPSAFCPFLARLEELGVPEDRLRCSVSGGP